MDDSQKRGKIDLGKLLKAADDPKYIGDMVSSGYKHGELAPDAPKAPIEPMAIDPNSKVNQGDTSGDGNDAKGKSKSKVDPAIFRMAEERDY